MRIMLVVLALATIGALGASAQKDAAKAVPRAADHAEPLLPVDVKYTGAFTGSKVGAPAGLTIQVESSPRGATLNVPSHHGTDGSVQLTFTKCAAPMRLTTRLTGMPPYPLKTLSVASGSLTLALGRVNRSGTMTKSYDIRGKEQDGPLGAAFTVRVVRSEKGELAIEIRRGAGAALDKSLTVSWQSDLGY